jgi:ABC-type uncharacterized transport system permease subunit
MQLAWILGGWLLVSLVWRQAIKRYSAVGN